MHSFIFHRATSLADAAKLLKQAEDPRLLAGGQTLIAAMKLRLVAPTELVDLSGVAELAGIRREGASLVIGASVRHSEVAASDLVRKSIPALAALAGGIGDRMVRNRGTLGGSVANNDPAADYPAALLALDATVHTDRRVIAAADFFRGMYETALESGEIITAVHFAVPQAAAYEKFPNPASRYALVGVFVARTDTGVRVAVTGAGPGVFRQAAMEQALSRHFAVASLDPVEVPAETLNTDMHASAAYRAHLVRVGAQRAVARIA